MWKVIVLSACLCFVTTGVLAAGEDMQAREEQAVAAARGGRYDEALEELVRLANAGMMPALWDEAVVLGWAGRHSQAAALYESRAYERWPEYARLSVAGSYYRLGQYKAAARLYHEAAAAGSRPAKRWEAESLMRAGDRSAANALYEELLAGDPQDADAYISRGNIWLALEETGRGISDLNRALALTADGEKQRDLRNQLAGLYIREGDYAKAVLCLKPAVDQKTATPRMQADYITALRLNGDFGGAVKEGRRLWPDLTAVPPYGVQALADSYLRSDQPKAAIALYRDILGRQGDIARKGVEASLAYALMLDGQVAPSKALYDRLLAEYPDFISFAIGDAVALMDYGRYWSAKELYKVIIKRYPENRQSRQQFAAALAAKGMPREAAAEYAALAKLPNSQPAAGAGLAVNSVAAGDYALARQGVEQLSGQAARNPAAAQAVKKFDERTLGEASVSASWSQDYKGNDNREYQLSGEDRLNDRLLVTAAAGINKLTKMDASAQYRNLSLGLRYRDLAQEAEAGLNAYRGDLTAGGYHARYTAFLGDQTSWSLELGRAPVDEAAAVRAGIMATSARLSLNRSIGSKDSFTAGVSRSSYSDGNQSFGYDGTWKHVYFDKDDVLREWSVYFSRSSFKYQSINGTDTPYESPSLRQIYGAALRSRWTLAHGYLENSFHLEWSKDTPDAFLFTPYDRLEYGLRFTPEQWLVVGFEYGLRNSGGWKFDHRNYDLTYQVNW